MPSEDDDWRLLAAAGEMDKGAWRDLVDHLRTGQFVPVIGPMLASEIFGSREDIALRWVRGGVNGPELPVRVHCQYDLAQVAQYVCVHDGDEAIRPVLRPGNGVRAQLKHQIKEEVMDRRQRHAAHRNSVWHDLPQRVVAGADPLPAIMEVGTRLYRRDRHDPYRLLAEMETCVYVTTGWTDLLQAALKENRKRPTTMAFHWRSETEAVPVGKGSTPTVAEPVVYHLFGRFDDLNSLVLTEDDYFAWLNAWARYRSRIPEFVLGALANNSLLFLGYRLDDWDFRVLFQSIFRLGGSPQLQNYRHVGVQFTRESRMFEHEAVQEYMKRYFNDANVSIYWGDTRAFLTCLRNMDLL